MNKKWHILPKIDDNLINKFPELPPVILQLLFNRGLKSQDEIDEFLNYDYKQGSHDPFLFNDMERAVTRIKTALKNQECVVIHGDYDADGVCSTTILYKTFIKIGFKNVDIYIPHREKEGYGINQNTIKYLREKGATLIVTCDCGISNKDEVAVANEFGIDIIITDHHHQPEILPAAFAIINPMVENEKYPFKYLAGSGVAFKLCQALMTSLKADKENGYFEKWLLDLVAIGTVADVSPLIGENRTLVKYGLIVLEKTKNLGLQKLIEVSAIKTDSINTYSISYQIAPRINSAGRIDHANTAFELLVTDNIEKAIVMASDLQKNNQERQRITDRATEEAKKIIMPEKNTDPIFFAEKDDWNSGIIGLIAGKITQEYYRPTFIFTQQGDNYVSSGRSIPEFNIIEAVEKQADLLERFGGHAAACGLTIKKSNYEVFKKQIKGLADKNLKELELKPSVEIDCELELTELNWQLADYINKFEPFGEMNFRPRFVTRNLTVNQVTPVGENNKHLKLSVNNENGQVKKVIIFNCESICPNLQLGDTIDLTYEIIINEWNGNKEIELNCIDLIKK